MTTAEEVLSLEHVERNRELVCRNVGFTWHAETPEGTEVLRDISFHLQTGEFVSIIGPSGCGKSTLLNLICGLVAPTTGSILVKGELLNGHRREVGIVFQDYGLFPWLNVEHNVEFGMRLNGVAAAARKVRTQDILAKVGLLAARKKYPHQLSGGMKQRVCIARVLANDSQYLLMDEPFGALDHQTRLLMQRFLLEIWREFGKTILFVTHQVEEALMLSERIFLMTARPGMFVEEIKVDLPHPRDTTSQAFNNHRIYITKHLEKEVLKGFEEQDGFRES